MSDQLCLTIRQYEDAIKGYGEPQPATSDGRLIVGTMDEITALIELSGPFGAVPLPAEAGETISVSDWFAACNPDGETS